jgi:hypothetical protein
MAELRGELGPENTERSSDDQRVSEISFKFTVVEFKRKNKRPLKNTQNESNFQLASTCVSLILLDERKASNNTFTQ